VKRIHVEEKLSKRRTLWSSLISSIHLRLCGIPTCPTLVRGGDALDKRVDDNIFKIAILDLLAKEEAAD
jgi:hypothetical protein